MSDEPTVRSRIAAAPISWGVCEVPGWGYQISVDRVFSEMTELGLSATEFGPAEFLPSSNDDKVQLFESAGIRPVGGFVPLVLHEEGSDPVPQAAQAIETHSNLGASHLTLSAVTGADGYDSSIALNREQWSVLAKNADRIAALGSDHGIDVTVHPHVGTVVQTQSDIEHLLEQSEIGICLDTGHLLIGGVDPVAFSEKYSGRVRHVHLKDVDLAVAETVRSGEVKYSEAVKLGLYRPIGLGDVDIPTIIRNLENSGYQGWYVMEQDTVVDSEPALGQGPVDDIRVSLANLERALA